MTVTLTMLMSHSMNLDDKYKQGMTGLYAGCPLLCFGGVSHLSLQLQKDSSTQSCPLGLADCVVHPLQLSKNTVLDLAGGMSMDDIRLGGYGLGCMGGV